MPSVQCCQCFWNPAHVLLSQPEIASFWCSEAGLFTSSQQVICCLLTALKLGAENKQAGSLSGSEFLPKLQENARLSCLVGSKNSWIHPCDLLPGACWGNECEVYLIHVQSISYHLSNSPSALKDFKCLLYFFPHPVFWNKHLILMWAALNSVSNKSKQYDFYRYIFQHSNQLHLIMKKSIILKVYWRSNFPFLQDLWSCIFPELP